MKLLNFSALLPRVKSCLRSFPMEAAAGLVFFVINWVYLHWGYDDKDPCKDFYEALYYVQLFFPVVIVAVYCLNKWFHGRMRWVYFGSLPVMLALLGIFLYVLEDFCDSSAYPFTLLLTAFVFFVRLPYSDNRQFSANAFRMLINAVLSGVTGLLLYFAVIAVVFALDTIFGWSSLIENTIGRAFFFIAYIIVPLLFCSMQDDDERKAVERYVPAKFLEIVLNYVLNPAIIAYTVIFYAYALKILFVWELPKGTVAVMVLAFIIASFAGQMSQLVVSKPIYRKFYQHFTWISLPPLCLFWIGLVFRIGMYGFTESRIYLVVAGVLMTAFEFFMLSKRLGRFRLMLMVSSVAIVLFTYIPGISAKHLGLVLQVGRCKSIANELGLLGKDGKLSTEKGYVATTEEQRKAAYELCNAYDYVEDSAGKPKAKQLLGMITLKSSDYAPDDDIQYNWASVDLNAPADISGYTKLLSNALVVNDSICVGDKRYMAMPDSSFFMKNAGRFDRWCKSKELVVDPEAFVYRTDSCMVVFHSLSRNGRGRWESNGYDLTLLMK